MSTTRQPLAARYAALSGEEQRIFRERLFELLSRGDDDTEPLTAMEERRLRRAFQEEDTVGLDTHPEVKYVRWAVRRVKDTGKLADFRPAYRQAR